MTVTKEQLRDAAAALAAAIERAAKRDQPHMLTPEELRTFVIVLRGIEEDAKSYEDG